MKDIQDRFINAFSKAIFNGDRSLVEEYTKILCKIVVRAWKLREKGKHSPYALETIERNCRKLLNSAADSDKSVSKLLFVQLMSRIYCNLMECIRIERVLNTEIPALDSPYLSLDTNNNKTQSNNKAQNHQPRQSFNILWDIFAWSPYIFCSKILNEIDIKALKYEVSIPTLLYNIQVTDFALFIESLNHRDDLSYWTPIFPVVHIQHYMGWYLNKQLDSNSISLLSFAKECVLSHNSLEHVTIRYDLKLILAKVLSIENATYICGLIAAGLTDLARDVFSPYLDAESQYSYHHYHKSTCSAEINFQFIFIVAPFCYLYYLGFWEKEMYVKPELREKAQKLARELSVQFKELLRRTDVLQLMIFELNDESIKTPSYISSIMSRFDQRAEKADKEEKSYTVVTENMVRDFCLFSILFAGTSNRPANFCRFGLYGLNWIGDDNHSKTPYIEDYANDKKEANTLKKLNDFLEFINETDSCIVYTEGEDKKIETLDDLVDANIGQKTEPKTYTAQELFENLKTIAY